jgi:hypothetical protein
MSAEYGYEWGVATVNNCCQLYTHNSALVSQHYLVNARVRRFVTI